MYATIRRYKAKSSQDLIRKVNEGFIPTISKAPGFIAFYAIDSGTGELASISVFETKAGESFPEVGERSVHRAPDSEVGVGGTGHPADDVNHRPVGGTELRPEKPGQPYRTEELEIEARVPEVVRELEERSALGGPGTIDEDVDHVELGCSGLMEGLAALESGEVGGDGHDPAAGSRLDLSRGLVQIRLGPRRDDHVASLGGKLGGDDLANTPASAGDDGDLVL